MEKRTALTAADLFVLLDREFRRRKPRDCASCFVQLPFHPQDAEPGSWEVIIPPQCDQGCAAMVEDLVADFKKRYELKRPGAKG